MARTRYKLNGYLELLVCVSVSSLAGCGLDLDEPHPRAAAVVLASQVQITRQQVLPGSYIVTFRAGTGASDIYFPSFKSEHRHHFSQLADRHLADPRIKDIQFLTAINLADPGDASWQADFGAPPALRFAWNDSNGKKPVGAMARVDFDSPEAASELLHEWDDDGVVWFAEPNYISRTSVLQDESLFGKLANDYSQLNYWWLSSIKLDQAFQAIASRDLAAAGTPTDEQILANRPIVAILDSGVDYEHPALKDRIWTNQDQNAAGCENDLHGCNTTAATRGRLGNGDVWPYDTTGPGQSCTGRDGNCSHGTHVAGIVAADRAWGDSEFSRATAGVCPVCQIMVLKIVSKIGEESGILDSSIIAAFKYVSLFRREGSPAVRVVNASFGKFVRSRAVGILVRLMKDKRGTIVIGAAGNEDTITMEYPAAFSDAIAVSAVDNQLRKVAFSNFGRWVDIAAPGSGILSTVPGGGVDVKSGTSMAAPMVAGVAGLMVARYPGIGFDELRKYLLEGADPSFYASSFEDGFNYNYYYPKVPDSEQRLPLLGLGLLNANATINRTPTDGLPIYASLDRVRPGCGIIGKSTAVSLPLLTLILALPFCIALRGTRNRRCLQEEASVQNS